MHEMAIVQSLIEIIREEMDKNKASILRSVRLNIGQMTAVIPESLSFCFEIMTADTKLEGARLDMDLIPLKGLCLECNNEFKISEYTFVCPRCDSNKVETITGQDLSIVEIEVE